MLEITGEVYGRLVAVKPMVLDREWHWLFRCECGAEKVMPISRVRRGNTRSCGCLHREQVAQRNRTHGLSHRPEHNAWSSMISRCENASVATYRHYGGRGITVCERWHTFALFIEDMGLRPTPAHSIDRTAVNGNYEPGNCRWATRQEQSLNRTSTAMVTYQGRRMSLVSAAQLCGIEVKPVRSRLRRGWSIDRSLETPLEMNAKRARALALRTGDRAGAVVT